MCLTVVAMVNMTSENSNIRVSLASPLNSSNHSFMTVNAAQSNQQQVPTEPPDSLTVYATLDDVPESAKLVPSGRAARIRAVIRRKLHKNMRRSAV